MYVVERGKASLINGLKLRLALIGNLLLSNIQLESKQVRHFMISQWEIQCLEFLKHFKYKTILRLCLPDFIVVCSTF